MFEDSPELRAICLRWMKAMHECDTGALSNLYSRAEAARYVGTDPDEWWSGSDIGTVTARHIEEAHLVLGFRVDIENADVEAYECDSAGWASVQTTMTYGDRDPVLTRFILVFVLEDGVWKIMLSVNSLATVTNPELMGVQLTTRLSELLDTLGDEPEGDLRSAVSEGTVTVMFTDIEDSTTLAFRLGDEQWVETLAWHDQVISDIVESQGGLIVKTLGDGAMAVFDSARRAARAAKEIQEAITEPAGCPEIRVRIGLHVGDVMRTGDDYLGHAVNKAARVASAAGGGEIMVSQAMMALLSDLPEFDFGAPFDTELKGLSGVHQLVKLK
jgi:class 3 adenylate cyclase